MLQNIRGDSAVNGGAGGKKCKDNFRVHEGKWLKPYNGKKKNNSVLDYNQICIYQ